MAAALPAPQAVLFDVGDTLLEERRFDLEAGIAAVVGDVALVATLAAEFRVTVVEHHRHEREPLLAAWLRARVPGLSSTALDDVEDAVWRRVVTLVARPGAAAVLRRLADDGVPAAAVSNAAFSGRVLRAELARHGLAGPEGMLRFVLSSGDVGARKPAVELFATAVSRLGVPAARTWFVGDRLEEDVAGAVRAGLSPILFAAREPTARVPDALPVVRDWAGFLALYESARDGARAG